jgi:hypothetical protein
MPYRAQGLGWAIRIGYAVSEDGVHRMTWSPGARRIWYNLL